MPKDVEVAAAISYGTLQTIVKHWVVPHTFEEAAVEPAAASVRLWLDAEVTDQIAFAPGATKDQIQYIAFGRIGAASWSATAADGGPLNP